MIQIHGNVAGTPTGTIELVVDNGHRYPVTIEGSRFSVAIPFEPSPFGAHLESAGKILSYLTIPQAGVWEADLPPVSMTPKSLVFGPPPSARITTAGRDFIQNGSRWVWKGASDFRLYQWYLENRDIQPVIDQRVEAGANILRTFGMYNGGIGRFIPAEYQHYWDGWHGFAETLAKSGLHLEITAFADAQTFMGATGEQQTHWGMLNSVVSSLPNVLVELANEYKKNGVDPRHFGPIPGILCSAGSGLGDEPGYRPGWNYHTWHGRRDWPKVLFSAEDAWYVGEGYDDSGHQVYPVLPVVHDEPIGFDDVPQPGRRTNDPYVARVLGLTGNAYCCGTTAHTSAGIQSALWSPQVDLCVRTLFANS